MRMNLETKGRSTGHGLRGLFSFEDAAAYLCVSPGTLRNWVSMRRIEYVKVGRLTRFTVDALDRYILAHTVRAADE
jgi:excisionase family DNA binding protein